MEFLRENWWIVLLAAILIAFLLYCILRARRLRRRTVELSEPTTDPALRERAAESLSQMIRFRTIAQEESEEEFRQQNFYIRERYPLTCAHLQVSTVDGQGLLCRWPGADESLRPILFCAHMDVVPAGQGWTHDAFGGERENGYIYGRGALDCKGPAVALLEAIESLLAQGFSPRRDVYFSIGHDEETGRKEGATRVAQYFEKQNIEFEMVLDEGDYVQRASAWIDQPAAFVDVAEKGVLTMRVTAHAPGGHASHPGARTCAAELAEAISRIEQAKFRPRVSRTTRAFFRELAPYMKTSEKFLYANSWIFKRAFIRTMCKNSYRNAILRTTAAVTMVYGGKAPNILPEKMEAVVSIRLLQGQTSQDVIKFYSLLLQGCDVELNIDLDGEPSAESDASGHYYKTLCRCIREKFGTVPVIPALSPSASDGRRYERVAHQVYSFVPLALEPEELAAMHGPEERMPEAELGRAVEFYRDFIRELQN